MNDDTEKPEREERNIFLRILCVLSFFIPFYYVTGSLVGGVVGGIAGAHAHANSYAEGVAAAQSALEKFFDKYGFIVFYCQVLVYAALCLLRWVPGVGKYKRAKKS